MIRGAELILFSGVVVDHIEQDLDAHIVKGLNHFDELAFGVVAGNVCVMQRAPGQRHVPPIAALERIALVYRQQLNRCHAQQREIGGVMPQPRKRAAQFVGHVLRQLRSATHVQLVHNKIAPRMSRPRSQGCARHLAA
ncbi:unannotated protein [freshwater metagenome]|uniref:Unannotated protein n=1 Tax=freshwater metagenome TaxID=449393 RepID=A0A6J6XED3_9ZZZZ